MTDRQATALRIVTITDGRPGNDVQAQGLAEAIGRQTPVQLARMHVSIRKGLDALPQSLHWRIASQNAAALGWLIKDSRKIDMLRKADVVIGAGRRGNLVAAAARLHFGVKAIANLNPQMPLSRFDAVIVPEHDKLSGGNVFPSLGAPNLITPERVAEAAKALRDFPQPMLAVLVGGKSKSAKFDEAGLNQLQADIARFTDQGWHIYLTPSRRTPSWAVEALRDQLSEDAVWDGQSANPYPGLLGRANAIMVTEDSVNMLSEAAATGLPLFVSGLGRVNDKFTAFHDALRARGITRPATEGPVAYSYDPLREADRLAAQIMPVLQAAQ